MRNSRVGQISLYDEPLNKFADSGRYGDLFVSALRMFGMLCIGIYRVRDLTANGPNASSRRYVICNPPDDFILVSSDLIFVLLQFDPGLEYHKTASEPGKPQSPSPTKEHVMTSRDCGGSDGPSTKVTPVVNSTTRDQQHTTNVDSMASGSTNQHHTKTSLM